MFGVSIEINAEMLQEQEHPKTIHRDMQSKFKDVEKRHLKLCLMMLLKEIQRRLKRKNNRKKCWKRKKLTLQAFERKNTELQVFYNEDKEKKKN